MAKERIPRIVHYCWFGKGEMPELYKKCIDSWKKHLKGYKFVCWNEDNFDVNSHHFTREAYAAKKYAFVSDYVRLWALYNYGGIYFDADVEVLRPLDEFLKYRAFTGCEREDIVTTGIIGSEKKHPWIKMLLDYYDNVHFEEEKMYKLINVLIITYLTILNYKWKPIGGYQILKDDLHIFPPEYFCPFFGGHFFPTKRTYTIHYFGGSWGDKKLKKLLNLKIREKFFSLIYPRFLMYLRKIIILIEYVFFQERKFEKLKNLIR